MNRSFGEQMNVRHHISEIERQHREMLKSKIIGQKLDARNQRIEMTTDESSYKNHLYRLKYEKCKSTVRKN